ncbi:DoxX family protein [Chitinophaga rhizophila]|nr:DoxX family protein [Chitinophaga rhizophila]
MAAFYVMAGINHFINPDIYTGIMPPWVPFHTELVYISGGVEVAGGLLLLPSTTRNIGAWMLIGLLLAVFPANIQMAINYYEVGHSMFWLTLVRLPFQLLLIWWAWKFTK